MKILFGFLIILFPMALFAQTFEMGSGIQIYDFKGELNDDLTGTFYPISDSKFNITAIFLGNIPVKRINEDVAIGISPNLSFGTLHDIYSLDVPVFITCKYGITSTHENEKNWGAGIGLGYQFSGFIAYLETYQVVRYSASYFNPVVMAEMSLYSNNTVYKLRFDTFPLKYSPFRKNFSGDITQYNLRIIRTFM